MVQASTLRLAKAARMGRRHAGDIPDIVVQKGTLAASHNDRHEEQVVRVDQPSLDRLRRKLRTADGQVTARRRLQLMDRFGVERSLDPGLGTGHRLLRLDGHMS